MMISKTAIVKDSKIGNGTNVYEFANIFGSKIGDNCTVGSHVEVQNETVIGDNCTVGSYVELQNKTVIGDNVTISSHSFICSLTTVEDNVFVGHGVMTINDVHPPSFRRTGSKEHWKGILIKQGAIIGSNATIFPVVIGENAVVGAGAVVTKDVPDGYVVAGNPARTISEENKHV